VIIGGMMESGQYAVGQKRLSSSVACHWPL